MPLDAVRIWVRGDSLFVASGSTVAKLPLGRWDVLERLLRTRASLAARSGVGAPAAPVKLDAMEVAKWVRANGISRMPAGDAIKRQLVPRDRKAVAYETMAQMLAEL